MGKGGHILTRRRAKENHSQQVTLGAGRYSGPGDREAWLWMRRRRKSQGQQRAVTGGWVTAA